MNNDQEKAASHFSHPQEREIEAARRRIRKDYDQQVYTEEEENPHPVGNRRLQEKAFFHYIETGDVEKFREQARLYPEEANLSTTREAKGFSKMLDRPESSEEVQVGRLSDDQLQQEIYLAISGITLYTRAAIDGGVPEHIAYTISDVYIREITRQKNKQIIAVLMTDCLLEFTESVAQYKYKDCSSITRNCCQYILRHLHEPLTLNTLARYADRSPHYISDLFAKELHIRPIAYIRREKLNYAAGLLENTGLSIYHISELLAFPSASAFACYFKKQYGCTPLEYRNGKRPTRQGR